MDSAKGKKKILILADHFVPAYKAGGPIQSLQNFCLLFRDQFEIAVITRNTDLGSTIPFEQVQSDDWQYNAELDCKVFYCSKKYQNYSSLKSLIQQQQFDFLYLNSLMSPVYTIYALWMYYTKAIRGSIVLSPRGELNPGALKIKALKKKLYLSLLKVSKLPQQLIWQATEEREKEFFHQMFGNNIEVRMATNIPKQVQREWRGLEKSAGKAKFIAVCRIARIKNIDFFLQCLKEVKGQMLLDIYGPNEDEQYLSECKALAAEVPANIEINFKGGLINSDIPDTLSQYHFFVSPTEGENFGHAIFEALLAAKPLLISDRTPWQNLRKHNIGVDLSLDSKKEWIAAVEQCIQMDQTTYDQQSKAAWSFAKAFREDRKIVDDFTELFS